MERKAQFPLGAAVTIADLEGDVHPILHRLRAAEPVSWLPALEAWLVTRHDDGVAIMRDAATFTVNHPGFSTAQVVGASMLSLDGEGHLRHRLPFERPFRRRAVAARFAEPVAQMVEELLDGLAAAAGGELRRGFAGPVAVGAMMVALGVEAATERVLGWYDAIVDAVTRVTAGEGVSAAGRAAFAKLRETLLAAMHEQPDSLLAAACGGGGLTDDEVVSNAAVLLFGGIETMEGMIANALYFFLKEAGLKEAAVRDKGVISAVIEESLRLEPAAAVVDRYATADVTVRSAAIRAGDLVRVSLSGANRDPAVFAEPDRFDIGRANLRSHLAFAQGPHVCVGLHLARLEAVVALERLLKRLPALRLVDAEEARPSGLVFRKPAALEAVW